jgi:hypothetical protein
MWHSCLHLLENESGAANVSKLNSDRDAYLLSTDPTLSLNAVCSMLRCRVSGL